MRDRFELFVSALLALSGLAIAGSVVSRTILDSTGTGGSARTTRPPEYVTGWERLMPEGTRIGQPTAPVQVVEFVDLECPYCKAFHSTYKQIRREFRDKVALTYLHLPLEMHRFARPAARALECAGEQSRFADFLDVVFEKQDSLGLKSWGSYAVEAGVADTSAFAACAARTTPVPQVERGKALAESLSFRETPVVLVNGWRIYGAADKEKVSLSIRALLGGEKP